MNNLDQTHVANYPGWWEYLTSLLRLSRKTRRWSGKERPVKTKRVKTGRGGEECIVLVSEICDTRSSSSQSFSSSRIGEAVGPVIKTWNPSRAIKASYTPAAVNTPRKCYHRSLTLWRPSNTEVLWANIHFVSAARYLLENFFLQGKTNCIGYVGF